MRFLAFLLLLFPLYVSAAPGDVHSNIAMDVADGVTHCGIFVDSDPKFVVPANGVAGANGCVFSLAPLGNGSHSVGATAIIEATATNTGAESPLSPLFTFAKPGSPTVPANTRLTP